MNYKTIHSQFKLNGVSHNSGSLKELAFRLTREEKGHEKHIGRFLNDWLNEKTEVAVKTSGSTGTPKTILLKKQHMVNSALATGKFFGLQSGTTALLCLPAQYIAGKMMLVRALVLGLDLDYVEPSTYPMEHLHKKYDFCAMVPMQLQSSLTAIENIKKLIVGGAQMSLGLKDRIQGKSTEVYETYGMTETITHIAIKKSNQTNIAGSKSATNHFLALPDVSFTKDERGCLVINAPRVASTPVITNDIVHLFSDTTFQWLGRFDNVVNSGGVKLFPEHIEAKLAPLIDHPFFVAGMPDSDLGQRLVLIIKGDFNTKPLFSKIKESGLLERFEVPKAVYSLPKFKTTANGKIQRNETLKLVDI